MWLSLYLYMPVGVCRVSGRFIYGAGSAREKTIASMFYVNVSRDDDVDVGDDDIYGVVYLLMPANVQPPTGINRTIIFFVASFICRLNVRSSSVER